MRLKTRVSKYALLTRERRGIIRCGCLRLAPLCADLNRVGKGGNNGTISATKGSTIY